MGEDKEEGVVIVEEVKETRYAWWYRRNGVLMSIPKRED